MWYLYLGVPKSVFGNWCAVYVLVIGIKDTPLKESDQIQQPLELPAASSRFVPRFWVTHYSLSIKR